jgi:prepilin-type N-terminal cleavage/methylation domain-containing protein
MTTARKGYTLVEVLVAVAILAIILPALTRFVVSSRQTSHSSNKSEVAVGLARRVMDSLEQVPSGSRNGDGTSTTVSWEGEAFQVVWNYRDAASKNYTGATPGAATVTVSFAFGNAGRRTVSLDGVLP